MADDTTAFRNAALQVMQSLSGRPSGLTLAGLEAEQAMLSKRLSAFGDAEDPADIWSRLGIAQAAQLPMLEAEPFVAMTAAYRIKE